LEKFKRWLCDDRMNVIVFIPSIALNLRVMSSFSSAWVLPGVSLTIGQCFDWTWCLVTNPDESHLMSCFTLYSDTVLARLLCRIKKSDTLSRIREVIDVRLLDGYITMSSFAYLSC
jgi:hypothetical protein